MHPSSRHPWAVILATALGVLALGASAVGLAVAQGGGLVRAAIVGDIPVRVYAPTQSAPTIVIAHGFAGSTQLMDPLARSLMRRGFTVVSYDTFGHGAHPIPLRTDGSPRGRSSEQLQESLAAVVDWAAAQPEVDAQRLALLGHSMGAGAVVEYASNDAGADRRIQATVALSLPSADRIRVDEPTVPRNLLLAVGALEPGSFQQAALDGMQRAYPAAAMGEAAGAFAEGTARQAIPIPGAEHIGIVFATATAQVTADWMGQALGVPAGNAPVAPVLGWFVLALIGTGLLLVPIGRLLLGRMEPPSGQSAGIPGARVLAVSAGAAVLASLIARLTAPVQDLLPVAVGGYVAVWFLAAGALALGWWAIRWRAAAPATTSLRAIVVGLLIALAVTAVVVIAGRASWAPFELVGSRPWVLAVLLIAFAGYFAADALLVRGRGPWARLGVIAGSRAIAIVVILASVALLQAPGFLILLLPLMVILLLVLGWYAAILLGYRGGWVAAAAVQALPLAALVATTFPLIMSP